MAIAECFKANDIRGRVPEDLNEEVAWRVGRAYAQLFNPSSVVIGRDVRLSSQILSTSLGQGLRSGGTNVIDIGLCGTEEVYFATAHGGFDGGIMVTASHNPMDYNGMKLVGRGAVPISGDTGLRDIQRLVLEKRFCDDHKTTGSLENKSFRDVYLELLLGMIDCSGLKPLKIVANPGNGCAGPVLDLLIRELPMEFVIINGEMDGTFPNGVPNPLLPENRHHTGEAVKAHGADLGIAWDGDFDRCFFFDEKGEFVEGYYIVGLLAEMMLRLNPGQKIIHDPRLYWNTLDVVRNAGGKAVMSRTGHALIKEKMRQEDALYGGEMSAHHYFRDFFYCDSGMIPWLLICQLISETGKPLGSLIHSCQVDYPVSGEINVRVSDPETVMSMARERYMEDDATLDLLDGLSLEFPEWRFNLRASNTEPLLRLNVETRGNEKLLESKTSDILAFLEEYL